MKRTGRKKEWSLLVFCLFLLGISPPVLYLFDKPILVFELPLSFLYLYGFWALIIVFIAIGARRRVSPPDNDDQKSGAADLKRRPERTGTDYV